ncbi:hypothetical protein [Acinetobacter chengduensis]|uniref:Uncharacterized protein n=1 Tax=Acinetobacter chengduensis TaxID=2420890 RepID=A0ABX9TSP1_9GAMM|nr:hypothetical protein [Acinetobacter chengduensis]RLL19019.1 hypothetical protein D9K81_14795 [Acinetobacter chengduensis]
MSRQTNNGFYVHNDLCLPELSNFERNVLRVEILLLNNSNGFFKSHIEKYLSSASTSVDEVLTALGAKELNGFWVHPHFYHNVRDGFMSYRNNSFGNSYEEAKIIVSQAIEENSAVPLHRLMRALRLHHPQDLLQVMRMILRDNYDRFTCHAVSCYMFRHFGHIHQVI